MIEPKLRWEDYLEMEARERADAEIIEFLLWILWLNSQPKPH